MVLLLKLLLGEQLLFPGPLQCPGDEPMFRLDRMILTSRPFDLVGSSFAPLLPEPIQLSTFLLQMFGSRERQLQGGWLQGGEHPAF